MENFHYYLYGKEFILKTDHSTLEAFNNKSFMESGRIKRWMERIQNYSFKVEYHKGEQMADVDALSRRIKSTAHVCQIGDEEVSVEERQTIEKIHEELIHRGKKAVSERLKVEGILIAQWKTEKRKYTKRVPDM
jgi:hypothetical protein